MTAENEFQKEKILLDDGRYMIFYDFDQISPDDNSPNKQNKRSENQPTGKGE